jgi:hypothetical protein
MQKYNKYGRWENINNSIKLYATPTSKIIYLNPLSGLRERKHATKITWHSFSPFAVIASGEERIKSNYDIL